MKRDILQKAERLFLFFLLTSVIGWVYEVFLEVVVYRWGYSDRGVLFGPYCVVYGVGSVCLLLALQGLYRRRICIGKRNITPALVFFCIVAFTTLLELAASYIMEWTQGGWAWDYTRFWMNFQGRIAPNPSLRFGIMGMLILYGVYPLFCRAVGRLSALQLARTTGVLAVLFLADCSVFVAQHFLL